MYAERLDLIPQLTLGHRRPLPTLTPRFNHPPCPAGWGVNLGCEHPTPDLDAAELRALARAQSPLSSISAQVLAAHSANLSLSYWSVGDARRALTLGYAALGEALPPHAQGAEWWPAPPQLWAQGGALLIGDPALSYALLEALSKKSP